MKLGINIRNMGPQSTRETLGACAVAADDAGLDSLWITDHIAIPPDDAEGSLGRYLDPLVTLAWLAGQTSRIKLGTAVLILPYRPALPTAKLVATLQELSGERLMLGVGIGWMEAEFRAVGRSLARRGADSDEILRFLGECFANDEVTLNGQTFLFKPRPIRPPILIGGRAPHAITRALRYGDGWLPMGPLAKLRPGIDAYRQQAADAGKAPPQIVTFAGLPLDASARCREILDEYRDAGVTTLVVGGGRYESAEEHIDTIAGVAEYLSYLTG
jgi:probable F420-dependent oxidoreductase